MCGRYILTAKPEELAALFGYPDGPWFPPRYNIAPTQPVAIVRHHDDAPRFALVRWGLVPAWVKEPRAFSLLINARAEGLVERPAFKGAFRHRRCLVPACGFYEWRRQPGGGKQPFLVHRRDRRPFAFAGLWETWLGSDGSEIDSVAIVTTGANRLLQPIHERMPVILDPVEYGRWLDTRTHAPAEVAGLLRPVPDGLLEATEVSARVNRTENDDPDLLEPAVPTLL